MKRMLLVSMDISNNAMGRVWLIADMLAERFTLEIIGYGKAEEVWKPIQGLSDHPIRRVGIKAYNPLLSMPALIRAIYKSDAEILYVFKPYFHHLAAAFIAKRGRPIIVDIDDWEAHNGKATASRFAWIRAIKRRGFNSVRAAEKLSGWADRITVSNRYLQEMFGGVVIPHARPVDFASSCELSADIIKARYGIPANVPILLFLGTARAHKGIDVLAEAMTQASSKVHLLIVGLDKVSNRTHALVQLLDGLLPGRYTAVSSIGWNDRHHMLHVADIIAIPQKASLFTQKGQSPAKLIDAMAAGKPIIASDLCDIAQTLSGAGWIVPPDDPRALAAAIDDVLAHPEEAQAKAKKARAVFEAGYNYDVVAKDLHAVFEKW